VLLLVYLLYLTFTMVTHSSLFSGSYVPEEGEAHAPPWDVRRSALVLAGATAMIAWISEIMVGAIEPTAHELGLTKVFVGVFVVAILGNAAEPAVAALSFSVVACTRSTISQRTRKWHEDDQSDDRDNDDQLLTVGQLAELWQVSPRTVRRMIADGRLPVVRLGRAVRISAKAAAP
jgi:excisionase family DNA binding protein